MSAPFDPGHAFLDRARTYLRDDILPRLVLALQSLGDDGIWQRANATSNSAANLGLHLAGNARQWIVAGVGGVPDTRRRQEEFDAQGGLTVDALVHRLREAFAEIDATLAATRPDQLADPRHIQGHDTTVFAAIFHVVEHIAMHTGQVILLAKAYGHTPIAFYEATPDGRARRTWDRSGTF